jgi:hypothetical protein
MHAYDSKNQKVEMCRAWWLIPVIPALRRLRQEGHEFKLEDRMGYITRPFQKRKKMRKRGKEGREEGRKERKTYLVKISPMPLFLEHQILLQR